MTTADPNAALQHYLASLQRSYEVLNQASSRASERGVKVSRRFLDDVAAGHSEASELAKRIDGKPEQAALAQASIMAATLAAQARALMFTQLVTDESTSARDDYQEVLEQIATVTRECSEAGAALVQAWASMNPLTEMMQRSMSSWKFGD